MLIASDLCVGLVARIERALYKVIEATHHAGQGKMGGFTHAKLRHLETGTRRESRSHPDAPIEDLTPERQALQFLYRRRPVQPLHAPGDVVDVKVTNTTPPARSHGGTSVWKEARLENGEMIRVDVARACTSNAHTRNSVSTSGCSGAADANAGRKETTRCLFE